MLCLREPVLKNEFSTHTDSEDQTRGLPQKRKVVGSQRWEASGKMFSGVNFSPHYLHVLCNIHWHWIASFLASHPASTHFLTLQVCECVCVYTRVSLYDVLVFSWNFLLLLKYCSRYFYQVGGLHSFPPYMIVSQHRFLRCDTWPRLPSVEIVDWIFWIERTGNNMAVSAVKR